MIHDEALMVACRCRLYSDFGESGARDIRDYASAQVTAELTRLLTFAETRAETVADVVAVVRGRLEELKE